MPGVACVGIIRYNGRMKNLFFGLMVVSGAMAAATVQPLFEMPFSVIGDGGESNRKFSRPVELAPGATYLFSFTARRASGSGCVVTGPGCANVDWYFQDPVASVRQFVFRTPTGKARQERFHLGGWRMKGEMVFEAASVRPVRAEWKTQRGVTLGHGEAIDGNSYSFTSQMNSAGRNDSRTLLSHTAGYNTQRWCVSGGQHVT